MMRVRVRKFACGCFQHINRKKGIRKAENQNPAFIRTQFTQIGFHIFITVRACVCLHSEDSCEDVMSSGEESLSSSLGSDAEGPFFPLHLRRQKHRQHFDA